MYTWKCFAVTTTLEEVYRLALLLGSPLLTPAVSFFILIHVRCDVVIFVAESLLGAVHMWVRLCLGPRVEGRGGLKGIMLMMRLSSRSSTIGGIV